MVGSAMGTVEIDAFTELQLKELSIVGCFQPAVPLEPHHFLPWTQRRNRETFMRHDRGRAGQARPPRHPPRAVPGGAGDLRDDPAGRRRLARHGLHLGLSLASWTKLGRHSRASSGHPGHLLRTESAGQEPFSAGAGAARPCLSAARRPRALRRPRRDLGAARMTNGVRELLTFEAGRARRYYRRARAAMPSHDRRALVAAEIMSAIYRALLRRDRGGRI